MVNRIIKIEDITGLPGAGLGGTVTLTLARGPRIKRINIRHKLSNTATLVAPSLANLGEIQVLAGGGIQRRHTALSLDAENALNGPEYASRAIAVAGAGNSPRHISIFFEEPWRTRVRTGSVDTSALGFCTAWLPNNKPVQIKIALPAVAGGTHAIEAEAVVDDFDNDGQPNPIIKVQSDDFTCTATNASITTIANGLKADDRIVSITAYNAAILTARLEVGPVTVFQDVEVESLRTQLRHNGLDPAGADAIQPGTHLVFDINDALDDSIPANFGSSLLKFAGAAMGVNMPMVTQVFGMPNRS